MDFDYFQVSLVFLFSVNCRELPRGARRSSIVVGHTLNRPSESGGAPLLPPCTEDDDDYDIASIGGRNENIPGVNCQAQDGGNNFQMFTLLGLM